MLDRHLRLDQDELHGKRHALQPEPLEIAGREHLQESIANGRLLNLDHSSTFQGKSEANLPATGGSTVRLRSRNRPLPSPR